MFALGSIIFGAECIATVGLNRGTVIFGTSVSMFARVIFCGISKIIVFEIAKCERFDTIFAG